MHTNQPTDLDREQVTSATEDEHQESSISSVEEASAVQAETDLDGVNGATETNDETEALAELWASNHEIQTAELSLYASEVEAEQGGSPPFSARIQPETIAANPADDTPTQSSVETDLLPADEVVDAPASVAIEVEQAPTDHVLDSAAEPAAVLEAAPTDVAKEPSAEVATTVIAEVNETAQEVATDAVTEAVATGEPAVDVAETPSVAEKVEPTHVHDESSDQKLIAEVATAQHKVYLLNRVKKAIAAAGESERAEPLKAVEAEILAEIETRKSAKEALCERAEALKDSTAWKVTGDAFKALFDEWRKIGAAGRELDDQVWARFNLARGAFNERRSRHFEEREVVWSANREQKEALCVEAEALADSTAWKATADAIRELQARWKAVGSAGREKDEALWARFNTAKQKFFDNRTAAWEENRKRKEALAIDAETLKDSTDWRTTGDAMKAMQTEWKNVGPAGRDHEDELWSRFRAATQTFFDRRSATFAERNQAERENSVKKTDLCVQAESLLYTGDALSAARVARDLQAQWKEIGPVPREQSEPLWARFREVCDKIFANASGERDRQQNEWHVRMREAMTRKRDQLSSLRESIAHDEANIERWRESLSTLKPGGKSEEIGKSLENKIIDVMDRIREKQERAEDLRSSITDIEAKLKE